MRYTTKRKVAKEIEKLMLTEELENQFLDDQHSRAYHAGVVDGLGRALFALSPKKAKRVPVSIVWFDEDYEAPKAPRLLERTRERSFELQHAGLFDTAEVD